MVIELLALRTMGYRSSSPSSEDRGMAELLYGPLVPGASFAVVVAAGLYIESRRIGLPHRR